MKNVSNKKNNMLTGFCSLGKRGPTLPLRNWIEDDWFKNSQQYRNIILV
jgi:hypothetical protein